MSRPTQIDRYRVTGVLGAGDFATVYRVDLDGAEWALKVCHDGGEPAKARLRAEVQALRALRHKAVPTYKAAGVWEDKPYLVMGLAKGVTLKSAIEQRIANGGTYGDIEAMRIVVALLDALAYVHGRGLVHRDIKDANILVTAAGDAVSLLDFGFAKPDGEVETRSDDSFWRAGAARFSPPAKLDNPARAVASHDVFAVGVATYRMLTGAYPWDADPRRDYSEVRQLMRQPARPLTDLNSRVRAQCSQLVLSLIRTEDSRRPTGATALTDARGTLKALEKLGGRPRHGTGGRLHLPHVSRDPLYGDIRLTAEEWRLLNTPQLQRLRWIRQLGLTHMVYIGAEHSRLSHVLGCVYRVEQILRAIEEVQGVTVDRETRLTARLYALVHDVTHVAYGHTLEDELNFFPRHDRNAPRAARLVLDPSSRLHEVLVASEVGSQILPHFDPDASVHRRSSVEELVTGSTGADVLDYIDRDAYYCGLDHRVDSAIFRQLRIGPSPTSEDDHLISLLYGAHGIRVDRQFAVESLLLERYALFLKVYVHPRKAAASALLGKALAAALYPPRGRAELAESEIERMGDVTLLDRLRASKKHAVSAPVERLWQRSLPRGIYRAQLLAEHDRTDSQYQTRRGAIEALGIFDPKRRQELEQELARAAGLTADEVFVYCPPRAPGHSRIEHWTETRPGDAHVIDAVSGPYHRIREKHLGLWELWVFSTGSDSTTLGRLAGEARDRFGFENLIALDRREDTLF
jgi:HD superfamily phosphohydrolase